MAKIQKTVHYKRAKINTTQLTLQELMESALNIANETEFASGRIYKNSDGELEFINKQYNQQNCLVGEFLYIEEDKSQDYISRQQDKKEFLIKSITPQSIVQEDEQPQLKTKNDFIQGALFFAIKDNDVLLLQSRSLTSYHFESHIKWLLIDRTNTIKDNSLVSLSDEIPKEIREKLKDSPVRSVSIGTPLETVNAGRNDGKKFEMSGPGAKVVSAILGDDYFKDNPISSSLDDSNVIVDVKIRFKRKTDDHGQTLLNDLSDAFRHNYSADAIIDLKNGGKISGGDLKLSTKISVEVSDGKILHTHLYSKMRDWLTENFD